MAEPFLSEIRIMSFVFAPKGWALCNGQLLPINQNQALFSLLGTTFGGDGRVNFALPDLRGRVPLHLGRRRRARPRARAAAPPPPGPTCAAASPSTSAAATPWASVLASRPTPSPWRRCPRTPTCSTPPTTTAPAPIPQALSSAPSTTATWLPPP